MDTSNYLEINPIFSNNQGRFGLWKWPLRPFLICTRSAGFQLLLNQQLVAWLSAELNQLWTETQFEKSLCEIADVNLKREQVQRLRWNGNFQIFLSRLLRQKIINLWNYWQVIKVVGLIFYQLGQNSGQYRENCEGDIEKSCNSFGKNNPSRSFPRHSSMKYCHQF